MITDSALIFATLTTVYHSLIQGSYFILRVLCHRFITQMFGANALSKAIIITVTVSYGFGQQVGHGQPLIESGIILPAGSEDEREERLIDGMDHGIKADYRGAIAIFSDLIQRYPDYADAYFNRGIAREKIQDYQGAIADQTKAITINPQLAEAYQARGKLHWQLGDRRSAKQDLQTAIALFESQGNDSSYHQAKTLMNQWQAP